MLLFCFKDNTIKYEKWQNIPILWNVKLQQTLKMSCTNAVFCKPKYEIHINASLIHKQTNHKLQIFKISNN